MKLIVQIPCHNEEKTLPLVVNSIPKRIAGIDKIEILVIDDASTDKTTLVAKALGVDHILSLLDHEGLAYAFQRGINKCIALGADIIVNTDGDNQYKGSDIHKLVLPIQVGDCDIVIADRQTHLIEEFTPLKKFLQRFGSWVVRKATGIRITDAVSGFRAYSRQAARFIHLTTDFSHTIETLFIARRFKILVGEVRVRTNPKTRESRLFDSITEHVWKSGKTIISLYFKYL